ncbi:MAG: hypothetical protein AAGC79_03425 [Pseudomonadota bacterium]
MLLFSSRCFYLRFKSYLCSEGRLDLAISINEKAYILCLVAGSLLLILLANLILWPFDYIPHIDTPNHYSRHLIHCQVDDSSGLGRFYDYDLEIVPNLAADLIFMFEAACQDVGFTQKVIVQFSSFGFLISIFVLHRAIWKAWSVWPLLATAILRHMSLGYGFENFSLTVPIVILVLAAWFFLIHLSVVARLALIWSPVLLVYILHLYAFGFLMMALFLLELQRWWNTRNIPGSRRRVFVALAMFGLIATIPALHLPTTLPTSDGYAIAATSFGDLLDRHMTIASPFAPYPYVEWPGAMRRDFLLVFMAICMVVLVCRFTRIPIRLAFEAKLLCIVALVVCFLVPPVLSGVYLTHIRFPVLTAAVIIAASRADFTLRAAATFSAVAVFLFGLRMFWLENTWSQYEADVQELFIATRDLSHENRVLIARENPAVPRVIQHTHSIFYPASEIGFYVPSAFTGGSSLKPRPLFESRNAPQFFPEPWKVLHEVSSARQDGLPAPYRHWRQFYTHMLVLRDESYPTVETYPFGEIIARGSFFDLVQIKPFGK